jgi:hypothetical protein
MKTFKLWVEETSHKKKLYVLVGPPSIGKSTWIQSTFGSEKPYIISRDDIVDQVASSMGLTYDDMFSGSPDIKEANDIINKKLKDKINNATNQDRDIVVDMTNMSSWARKNALSAIQGKESEYEKIAVLFPFQGAEDIIKKVAAKRAAKAKAAGGSKTIPDAAFDRMFANYEDVSTSEGFDKIIHQDNRKILQNSLESTLD